MGQTTSRLQGLLCARSGVHSALELVLSSTRAKVFHVCVADALFIHRSPHSASRRLAESEGDCFIQIPQNKLPLNIIILFCRPVLDYRPAFCRGKVRPQKFFLKANFCERTRLI